MSQGDLQKRKQTSAGKPSFSQPCCTALPCHQWRSQMSLACLASCCWTDLHHRSPRSHIQRPAGSHAQSPAGWLPAPQTAQPAEVTPAATAPEAVPVANQSQKATAVVATTAVVRLEFVIFVLWLQIKLMQKLHIACTQSILLLNRWLRA